MRSPERIGPYLVEQPLGSGGMGAVYRARDPHTGALYAVKVLSAGANAQLRLRFQREGEAHARVDRHPNVVGVHAAGQDGERVYLAMDLVEGGDLQERLRSGPLPIVEAAEIARDLARGLAHLHSRGVLHRDLKPANVLLSRDGRPQLADFGVAQMAGSASLTETGTLLGTPAYMAPEQVVGEEEEPRTDVYGLGAVLHHVLTGSPPYQGPTGLAVLTQITQGPPRRVRSLRPDCPAALDAICRRAMAQRKEDRYPDAAALAEALDGYLRGELVETQGGGWLWPALGGLVVVVLAGVGALAVSQRVSESPGRVEPEVDLPSPDRPSAPTPRSGAGRPESASKPVTTEEVQYLMMKVAGRPAAPDLNLREIDALLRRMDAGTAPALRSNMLLMRGRVFLKQRKWREARRAFDQALKLLPEQIEALGGRVRAAVRLGDSATVFRDCTAMLAATEKPKGDRLYETYLRRAVARLRLDPSAKQAAWDDFASALEVRDGITVRFGRVRLARDWRRWCLAQRELAALFRLFEQRRPSTTQLTWAHRTRGWARIKLCDVWGAEEDLKAAVSHGETVGRARVLRRAITKLREQHPRWSEVLDPITALGRTSDTSKSPKELLACYTRAMAANPAAGLLIRRAKMLGALRRFGDARDDLRWARALDPENPDVQRTLEELGQGD